MSQAWRALCARVTISSVHEASETYWSMLMASRSSPGGARTSALGGATVSSLRGGLPSAASRALVKHVLHQHSQRAQHHAVRLAEEATPLARAFLEHQPAHVHNAADQLEVGAAQIPRFSPEPVSGKLFSRESVSRSTYSSLPAPSNAENGRLIN